ncbi:MAG: hypothetical protein IJF29_00275 [Firmicutes bacterium]|nr:hypothetical protein [Bacillota bacterium]
MKSKAPLVLMEEVIMVLAFAFAMAVCMKIFVFSYDVSNETKNASVAMFKAQNMAETIKRTGGEILEEDTEKYIYYDEDWKESSVKEDFYMAVVRTGAHEGTGRAEITVYDGEEVLFGIPVVWQEVGYDE